MQADGVSGRAHREQGERLTSDLSSSTGCLCTAIFGILKQFSWFDVQKVTSRHRERERDMSNEEK
jgi:hypothetical protein